MVICRYDVTQRLDQHDKQIAALRDLVKEGIKMVVEIRHLTLETRKDLRKLAAMQLTPRRPEAYRREPACSDCSLRGGGNGHTKRRVE